MEKTSELGNVNGRTHKLIDKKLSKEYYHSKIFWFAVIVHNRMQEEWLYLKYEL